MSSFNLLNSPLYVKGKEDKIRIIDLLIILIRTYSESVTMVPTLNYILF